MKTFLIRNSLKILIVMACVVSFSGCATTRFDDLGYVQDAVIVNIAASNTLNAYNAQAHTIVLSLFELSDPNMFNQLREKKEGVIKLLGTGKFDASVLSRRKFIIQPGQKKVISLDRVSGARYLGIVAGYFDLQRSEDYSRLYSLELTYAPNYYWSRSKNPKVLVKLLLGESSFIRK